MLESSLLSLSSVVSLLSSLSSLSSDVGVVVGAVAVLVPLVEDVDAVGVTDIEPKLDQVEAKSKPHEVTISRTSTISSVLLILEFVFYHTIVVCLNLRNACLAIGEDSRGIGRAADTINELLIVVVIVVVIVLAIALH